MIIARQHRGQLADSMETARTFDTIEEMKQWFADCCNCMMVDNLGCTIGDIVIDSEHIYDKRVGWDTHYVCTKKFGNLDFMERCGCPQCIGMCDLDYIPKCNTMNACPDIGTKECAICGIKNTIPVLRREGY